MQILRHATTKLGLLLPALVVILLLAPLSAAQAATRPEVIAQAQTLDSAIASTLNTYATTAGPFVGGLWTTPDTCWGCDQGGPATAAATLFVIGGRTDGTLLHKAEQTIDKTIATHQAASGIWLDTPGDPSSADDVETEFFGVELGTVYELLAPNLPTAEAAKWQKSLTATADYFVSHGNLTYWSNGNVNLALVEFMYLVWMATGRSQYLADYQIALTSTVSPLAQSATGLIITKTPTKADGSDGAGYFTESNTGGPGYDPEYTELQLEAVSRLYLLSRDSRILRLVNLLTNQLLPRLNRNTMMLNTSDGSRHPESGRTVNFLTPAFTILSLFDGRADLLAPAVSELQAESSDYLDQPWQLYNPVFRRSLGNDLSVSALALYIAGGGKVPLG